MPGRRSLSFHSDKMNFFQNKINEIRPKMNLNCEKDLIYPTEYTFRELFDEFEGTPEDRLIFLELVLMTAVHKGDTNLVRYLLNFNINDTPVHALTTEEGILWKNATFEVAYGVSRALKTLLGEAAHCGHLQVVKCLVNEFNVDVNAYSPEGYTALHEVVQGDGGCVPAGPGIDHGLIVDFLMKSGADPALKSKPRRGLVDNTKSQTPLEMTEWCKPGFLKIRMDYAYDADKSRPYLILYQKKLENSEPIYQIKLEVQKELDNSLSNIDNMEINLIKDISGYLAYDVDDANLNSLETKEKKSFCVVQ